MATRVKMTSLERMILDRVFLSATGFERVEDLHDAVGADQTDFVNALESLEGDGYLSISNLGGAIVVAFDDPLSDGSGVPVAPALAYASRVGHC